MTVQFDRNQSRQTIGETTEADSHPVRRYQIRANVVNVYQSVANNDNTDSGLDLSRTHIRFDDNHTFETNKPIFIPYSKPD